MSAIACYLSSHGYGHAVRSAAVIDEIARLRPEAKIVVVSAAPAFLFERLCRERPLVRLRSQAVDFGLVQKDPRHFSLTESAERLEALIKEAENLVKREQDFLVAEEISAVWCDLPFLPFEAAFRTGLPSVGMGNFSWDWVYAYYHKFSSVFSRAAELAATCYQRAGLYLRLPFSPPANAFPLQEEIPLACRTPQLSRAEVRARYGIQAGLRVVLIAFSGLALGAAARSRLEALRETVFLLPEPIELQLANGITVPAGKPDFPSLVAASDIVVTKPGYGIVTDAIACNTPLVYTERGDFPEVPWLEDLIRHTLGGAPLLLEEFESGKWDKALEAAVLARDAIRQRAPLALDGTQVAARRFLDFCDI